MMKHKIKKTVLFLFVSFLTFASYAFSESNTAYANEGNFTKKTISVSGAYTVKVAPDIAYIDIAVNTLDVDAKKAQEINTENMNKVMDQLKKMGIQDKDIRTVDYRIQPRYEWINVETKREQKLLGYEVTNNIKVTINDFQKIGNIIDMTVKEGVNEVNNIAFGLSEAKKTEKYLEALKGAVNDGKIKAENIASMYGIKLSIPSMITEAGSYIPSPINYAGLQKASLGGTSFDTIESTPISGGEMEIRANINIVYEY
ncbi:SIMPL domain-containing protein [Schinkia azotoformans]|uniref:SIMPL domain-containing protein n=1 Tax=Schinkia azotoformans TaxID=1454 RepID=UPI002E1A111B|nr:SIMPL domain-containing protein [Schinkia azotoformans]MED4354636.1 SIMPL domain-containing protein [Schinkia azotoformans]